MYRLRISDIEMRTRLLTSRKWKRNTLSPAPCSILACIAAPAIHVFPRCMPSPDACLARGGARSRKRGLRVITCHQLGICAPTGLAHGPPRSPKKHSCQQNVVGLRKLRRVNPNPNPFSSSHNLIRQARVNKWHLEHLEASF